MKPLLRAFAFGVLRLVEWPVVDADVFTTPLAFVNDDGSIDYEADERGNRIPDFSTVGYRGGEDVDLPAGLPVKEVRPPLFGTSARRLVQDAIDEVGGYPFHDGSKFRGVVLLKRGTFRTDGPLRLRDSGVVLRGEGGGADRTVLESTTTERISLIEVGARDDFVAREVGGSGGRVALMDDYVPVGAASVNVTAVEKFAVGDTVHLFRPPSPEWIEAIGMDRIPDCTPPLRGRSCGQWDPDSYAFGFERIVTAVRGEHMLSLDAPVVMAFAREFGGGSVNKVEIVRPRIEEVGVENLVLKTTYKIGKENKDEAHAWTAVAVGSAQDAFVRGVSCYHFGYACVNVGRRARRVTVEDCDSNDPVSRITGGRRYSFNVDGSLALVRNCTASKGRHDFVSGSKVEGPNVFTRCTARDAYNDIGPHYHWAMGFLYDNVATDGAINVRNRGYLGSGHGWAGANHVVWNGVAGKMFVESPDDGSTNRCVGCRADYDLKGSGPYERPGVVVAPESLHEAQVRARRAAAGGSPTPSGSPTPGGSPGGPPGGFPADPSSFYCGMNYNDANGKCDVPCMDGNSASCPTEESCFPFTTCRQNQPPPDPSSFYCGMNYDDANGKCDLPCPDGDSARCPRTESCFPFTTCRQN